MAELVHEDGIDITSLFSAKFLRKVTDTIADLVSKINDHVMCVLY